MNEPIEIICGYAVHPAAAMFPLIEGDEFDQLVDSIARNGMHHPIVLRGDQLLDGRNRLRAVEAAREQGYKVSISTHQWIEGKTSVSEWIWDTNATRRQLTDDGLAMAAASITPMVLAENAERKKASQFTQGKSGNPSGKKQVTTNPSLPAQRDRKADDARSTVGQVAAKAKTSIHKARQAIAVQKAIEDGTIPADTAKAVISGKAKFKDVLPKKLTIMKQDVRVSVLDDVGDRDAPAKPKPVSIKNECIEPTLMLDEISYYALSFLEACPERADELEGLLLTWVSRCKKR